MPTRPNDTVRAASTAAIDRLLITGQILAISVVNHSNKVNSGHGFSDFSGSKVPVDKIKKLQTGADKTERYSEY
ncbi:hypothetical protein J6590_103755 [Homalodisca vitripennis]|nr:hypothetical protein J6590_103755 [Homalodisca vitripennis]